MNETVLGATLKPGPLGKERTGLFVSMPVVYVCIILLAVLASYAYWMRKYSILGCVADGYSADRYLAYCNASGYGDYEHGAFWFDLEPSARDFARSADVLFLGNSRTQVGFSTPATADWFSTASIRYYLLGFTYYDGASFEGALLRRIRPKARVYVINLDEFFRQWKSPPATTVMDDPGARGRYESKRLWQSVHGPICRLTRFFCAHNYAIFRSRENGSFDWSFGGYKPVGKPVSYDRNVSDDLVKSQTAAAAQFLSGLPVQENCVILTMIPTAGTKTGNVKAIAAALHKDLVMPEVSGLQTFDGSHLDQQSAERWSEAFFQAAGPEIRSCLEKHGGASRS